MIRKITVAASVAALAALGACSRGDNAAYDTAAAGATTGAMATPPAVGLSTGATTTVGMSTGATTTVDTTASKTKRP
jgi:hypothetical protein